MKILLVKLSSLGDVIHTLPVVQDLRTAVPGVQIDWVLEKAFAPVLQHCQGLGRVLTCEIRRWRKSPLSASTRSEWRAFMAQLQAQSYDAVIDLQGLTKSAVVARCARLAPGGKRYAMANRTEGSGYEAPTRWLADVAITLPVHIHAVLRGRLLCAQALGYCLEELPNYGLKVIPAKQGIAAPQEAGIQPGADSFPQGSPKENSAPSGGSEPHEVGSVGATSPAQGSPKENSAPSGGSGVHEVGSVGARPFLLLVHGTSRSDKEWPAPHWISLGQQLAGDGYDLALPHGNAAELATSQALAAGINAAAGGQVARVWPRLPLDALTQRMAACCGVIGVDSGLSHLAVALDLPHVQLYNFETAWRTGPAPAQAQSAARQQSVYAAPTPSLAAVLAAWRSVCATHAAVAQAVPRPAA